MAKQDILSEIKKLYYDSGNWYSWHPDFNTEMSEYWLELIPYLNIEGLVLVRNKLKALYDTRDRRYDSK